MGKLFYKIDHWSPALTGAPLDQIGKLTLEPLSLVLCSGCQQTLSHQWTLKRRFEAWILLLDQWWWLSRPLEGSSRWPSWSWRSSSAWPCMGRSYHSSWSLRSYWPGIHTDQTWLKICLDHYGRNRDSYIELSYMKADVIINISNMDSSLFHYLCSFCWSARGL